MRVATKMTMPVHRTNTVIRTNPWSRSTVHTATALLPPAPPTTTNNPVLSTWCPTAVTRAAIIVSQWCTSLSRTRHPTRAATPPEARTQTSQITRRCTTSSSLTWIILPTTATIASVTATALREITLTQVPIPLSYPPLFSQQCHIMVTTKFPQPHPFCYCVSQQFLSAYNSFCTKTLIFHHFYYFSASDFLLRHNCSVTYRR